MEVIKGDTRSLDYSPHGDKQGVGSELGIQSGP